MMLKNSDVKPLAEFLSEEKLAGKTSRMRTRFIKILTEKHQENEDFRMELLEKHAKKDENEQPIITNGAFELEDSAAFNKEYDELMNEDFIIDETESKREILTHVKRILENTDTTLNGVRAFMYDRWCEAFETLTYEDKSKA